MGCTSSADKYGKAVTPAVASPSAASHASHPSHPSHAQPSPASATAATAGEGRRGSRVIEENAEVVVASRAIQMVGLRQDDDGDEAHEFFEEDPKTGEMRQIRTKDLVEVT